MPPQSAQPDVSTKGDAVRAQPTVAAELGAVPNVALPSVAEIYEAELTYVFRCLRALGVGPASIDDAVQDVFIVVQKRLHEFEGRSALRTWLYAIALRVARKYRERRARESTRLVDLDLGDYAEPHALLGGDQRSDHGSEQEAAQQHAERLVIANAALERLDPSKREIFVLIVVEQLSGPEAAQIMGLPLGTVYSRLRAARAAFDGHVAQLSSQQPRRKP